MSATMTKAVEVVRLPVAALWRKKDVLALGACSAWEFWRATREGRLAGTVLPGRRYHLYRRDAVCRAFGIAPVTRCGRPADVWAAEYGKVATR